jgi:hypothetical protein
VTLKGKQFEKFAKSAVSNAIHNLTFVDRKINMKTHE